ncbi:MAG: hypothetical protein Q4C49_12740 [Bacillota bacterium]|nr:hypothetical protein [Bacillota bacterium]
MIQSTSNLSFQKYGETFENHTGNKSVYPNNFQLHIKDKQINRLFKPSEDIYVKPIRGAILLMISESVNAPFEEFIVQKIIKIKKGMVFNFIALSENSILELNFVGSCVIENVFLKHFLQPHFVRPTFTIQEIITEYLNETSQEKITLYDDMSFHKVLYVYEGKLCVHSKETKVFLNKQDFALFPPSFSLAEEVSINCKFLTILLKMDIADTKIPKIITVPRNVMDSYIEASLQGDYLEKEHILYTIFEKKQPPK